MKKIILIVAILVSVNNVCFAEAEKQKQQNQRIDTQKVEIKQSNNCPVACNKNCTKDPKTCPKAQKKIKKQNELNRTHDTKNDSLKSNKDNEKGKQ